MERVLATVSFAGGIAVLEELALGLVGAGGSPWAPAAAAAATWVIALAALPRPQEGALEDVSRWWSGLSPGARAGLGALAGAVTAIAAAILYRPAIGFDNSLYRYVEPLAWVHNGHPGSIVRLSYDYPFGSYPLTNEVLLTWGTATARSFAPMELWVLGPLVLLGLALWLTARLLRIPPVAAGAIVAFVLGLSWLARVSEATNDAASLAWAVSAVGLALASAHRPRLLAPALVAGGWRWERRRHRFCSSSWPLRPHSMPIAVACARCGPNWRWREWPPSCWRCPGTCETSCSTVRRCGPSRRRPGETPFLPS